MQNDTKSIDEAAQRKRRRDAWHSTVTASIILLVSAIVVLNLSILNV